MGTMASLITSLTIVYDSIVYSGADKKKKHQSSTSLAFVRGIHRGPVNSPHKWPVTRKMFPFDDVIMCYDVVMMQNTAASSRNQVNINSMLCHIQMQFKIICPDTYDGLHVFTDPERKLSNSNSLLSQRHTPHSDHKLRWRDRAVWGGV